MEFGCVYTRARDQSGRDLLFMEPPIDFPLAPGVGFDPIDLTIRYTANIPQRQTIAQCVNQLNDRLFAFSEYGDVSLGSEQGEFRHGGYVLAADNDRSMTKPCTNQIDKFDDCRPFVRENYGDANNIGRGRNPLDD